MVSIMLRCFVEDLRAVGGVSKVAYTEPLSCHIFLHSNIALLNAQESISQLSAMDVSARATMKDAAKCGKHRELQNSVKLQNFERILYFWDIPESFPTSVSFSFSATVLQMLHSVSAWATSRRVRF